MSYFWLIMVLIVLILIAIDPRSFGSWNRKWYDFGIFGYLRSVSDIEIRSEYRRNDCQHIPYVHPGEIPEFPDPILDRLIYEDCLDEANFYRMKQLRAARDRKDNAGVKSYEVYKLRITARRIELEEIHRRTMKAKYEKNKHKFKISARDPSDPMALPDELIEKKEIRERVQSGYLEIERKGILKPPVKQESELVPTMVRDRDRGEETGIADRSGSNDPSPVSNRENVESESPAVAGKDTQEARQDEDTFEDLISI